jgi:hypothetical protein
VVSCIFFGLCFLSLNGDVSGREGLTLESAGLAPQGFSIQSGAIVIRCVVKNNADIPHEGMLVAKLTSELASEDRCRVRLEGQRSGVFEFPVRVPPTNLDEKVQVDVSMVAWRDGREVSLAAGEQPEVLRVVTWRPKIKRNIVTALALGPEPIPPTDWRWEKPEKFDTLECALASRIDAELTNDCIIFGRGLLPLNWLDWQGIDLLILADPRHLKDHATVSILRSYVARGGRIWIMLDAIDTSLISPLLEHHQSIRHVDTVELRKVKVEVKNAKLSDEDRTSTYDRSIPFKRVVQSGGEAIHTIDGWPASIVMPIGRGELVFTMLDSDGWIEPRKTTSQDPIYYSEFELRRWARSIVESLYVQRTTPLLKLTEMTYPLERIGNPVVSREFVTVALLSFCIALCVLGTWRFTFGEVPKIGWWLPALSVIASAPILIAGILQKKDIPNTVSLLQWIQYDNPSGGSMRESAAVYLDNPSSMDLQATRNGFALADPKIQTGITTVVRDGLEHWQMTNPSWPAGAWRYTTDSVLTGNSMIAYGKWTTNGLEVQLPAEFSSPLSDPIISFVAGAPALGKTDNGKKILIDGKFPAEGERWTLQSMVDDEQRRRADVYRKYFSGNDRLQVQTRTLVGWSALSAHGPTWTPPIERRGTALVSFPVVLQTPEKGDEVFVPYPFITIRNTSVGVSTPIFMDGIGKWITQSSSPSSTVVEFLLPNEVVPIQAQSLQISWDVEAPRRVARLSFIHPTRAEPTQLVELDAPSIPWEASLEDPLLLEALGNGSLMLKIEVSPDREPGGTLPWRIRHLRLAVRGKTLPKHAWSSTPRNPVANP